MNRTRDRQLVNVFRAPITLPGGGEIESANPLYQDHMVAPSWDSVLTDGEPDDVTDVHILQLVHRTWDDLDEGGDLTRLDQYGVPREGLTLEQAVCDPGIRALVAPPYVTPVATRHEGSRELVLASLRANVTPEARRDRCGVPWCEVLDTDGDSLALLPMLEAYEAGELPGTDGGPIVSLVHFEKLDVHPLMRGQGLGLRLLAHAIARLSGGYSDLFVMQAMPAKSAYRPDESKPTPTRKDAARLARYYQRLGFRRFRQKGESAVPLYLAAQNVTPVSRAFAVLRGS